MMEKEIEKFLTYMNNIEEIEISQKKLALKKEKEINKIKDWGKFVLTREKRSEIIKYCEENAAEWVVKDLEIVHQNWDEDKITYSDVVKFAKYDINIHRYKQTAYNGTNIIKLHSLLLGGDKDE